MKEVKRIGLLVDQELAEEVQRYAAASNRSVNNAICVLLKRAIKQARADYCRDNGEYDII